MEGLKGHGPAKAWSWERSCYEVRWERLAKYVKDRMEGQQLSDTANGGGSRCHRTPVAGAY